jgi:hypothetical protein
MRATLSAALLLVATATARAEPDCRAEAAAAERAQGVPEGLLAAIGIVESGRRDPLTGHVAPWPWSVNEAGIDHVFASRDEAVAYVARRQALGVRSLDVGCFQVNLLHHPNAFATLEEAFDPAANARYAARFLSELAARSGSWTAAVGFYHSATPELAEPYRAAVLARWRGEDSPIPGPAFKVQVIEPGSSVRPVGARLPRVIVPSWATARQ